MHVHTVFFWLWKTTSDDERIRFEQGLAALTRDANVLDRRVGKPSATNRSVVDSSYDYGVVLCFRDLAAHDSYQSGQAHQQFLKTCGHMWARVQVYDIDETSLNDQQG